MTSRRSVAGRALVAAAALALGATLMPLASTAGASRAAQFDPVVVQSAQANLNGPDGHGVEGPAPFAATLAHPTRPGDLLVAAVIDGVITSGMRQPSWHPAGWRLGRAVIGGETATDGGGAPDTGGLEAAIWYFPDNPGGITTVHFGSVPDGTQAVLTAVVAELGGLPRNLRAEVTGSSTSGPSAGTDTNASAVAAVSAPPTLPALVLAAFTNGGTTPSGERFEHSSGWRVLGSDPNRNGVDQPLLFDERVWQSDSAPSESMSYLGGSPIDNCAAIVALGRGPVR